MTRLALGFRPLYLLAGTLAALGLAYWIAGMTGAVPVADTARNPLWVAAFALFVGAYLPILTRSLLDGRPG